MRLPGFFHGNISAALTLHCSGSAGATLHSATIASRRADRAQRNPPARNALEWGEVARRVLDAHFPESIRQDLLDAVGLFLEPADADGGDSAARRRDPAFREKILLAYEYVPVFPWQTLYRRN
jgi:putative restriction endonuclease